MPVEIISAATYRAAAMRAHRLHEARLLAGHDDEESAEAEAGALLEAERDGAICETRDLFKAWLEAQEG